MGDELELGYFTEWETEWELEAAKQGMTGLRGVPIERDLYFTPCRLSAVKKLHGVSRV